MGSSNARIIKRLGETNCHYCEIEFSNDKWRIATIDHKISKKCGGKDEVENYVVACKRCNMLKGSKSYETFKELLERNHQWSKKYNLTKS